MQKEKLLFASIKLSFRVALKEIIMKKLPIRFKLVSYRGQSFLRVWPVNTGQLHTGSTVDPCLSKVSAL